jgi:hypothetical protein
MIRVLKLKRRIREFIVKRLRSQLRSTFRGLVASSANQKQDRLVRKYRASLLLRKSWRGLRHWTRDKRLEKKIFAQKIVCVVRKKLRVYFGVLKARPARRCRLLKKALAVLVKYRNRKRKLRIGQQAIEKRITQNKFSKWTHALRANKIQHDIEHLNQQRAIRSSFAVWQKKWTRGVLGRYFSGVIDKVVRHSLERSSMLEIRTNSRLALFASKRIFQRRQFVFKHFRLVSASTKKCRMAIARMLETVDSIQSRFQKKGALVRLRLRKFQSAKFEIRRKKIQLIFIRALKQNQEENRHIREKFWLKKIWQQLKQSTTVMKQSVQKSLLTFNLKKQGKLFGQLKTAVTCSKQSKIHLRQFFCKLQSISTAITYRHFLSSLSQISFEHFVISGTTLLGHCLARHESHCKRTALKRFALQFRYDYFRKNAYQKKLTLVRMFKSWREVVTKKRIAEKISLIYVLNVLKKSYFGLKINYLRKKIQRFQTNYLTKSFVFGRWQRAVTSTKRERACRRLAKATIVKQLDVIIRLQRNCKEFALRENLELKIKKVYIQRLLKSFIWAKIFRNLEGFVLAKMASLAFKVLGENHGQAIGGHDGHKFN